jgi:hypothetical protein
MFVSGCDLEKVGFHVPNNCSLSLSLHHGKKRQHNHDIASPLVCTFLKGLIVATEFDSFYSV